MKKLRAKLALFQFLLFLTVYVRNAICFYELSQNVISLSDEDFQQKVQDSSDLWVIEFFAPWCQHCEAFAPEYEKVAEELRKFGVKVGAVNSETASKTMRGEMVKGLPTVKFYFGKGTINPYTRKKFRPSTLFEGAKSARAVQKGLFKSLPASLVNKVTSKSASRFFQNATDSGLNQIIVFTERTSTAPLFLSLAHHFYERLVFGEVQSSDEELASEYGVDAFPAVVAVPIKGQPVKFAGNLKDYDELQSFCNTFAKEVQQTEKGSVEPVSAIVTVTSANFTESVVESPFAWVVVYLGDNDSLDMIPSWTKLSKSFEGHLKGALVQCSTSSDLCEENLETPYLKVFPYEKKPGSKLKLSTKYTSKKANKAFEVAGNSLPNQVFVIGEQASQGSDISEHLREQVGYTFQSEGKLPMIVASRKAEPSIVLKSLSTEFEKHFRIIMLVNPSKEILRNLNDLKVPGFCIMMPQQIVNQADTKEVRMGIVHYDPEVFGPFTFSNIAEFMSMTLAQHDPEKAQLLKKTPEPAVRKREVSKITAKNWMEACPPAASVLCVVTLLDGYSSAESQEESVALLKEILALEEKRGGSPFEFSYTLGNCDLPFAEAFEVDPAMHLPAVVVYSPKKERFVRHVGRFDIESVREFLRGVTSNRIKTGPLLKTPVPGDAECSDITDGDETLMDHEDADDFMAEILLEEQREKERLARELREEEEKRKLEEAEKKKSEKASKKKKKKKKKTEL